MDSAQALMSSGLPFVQGVTIIHVFDPTVMPGELIFGHVFKFTPVKLSKSPLLGDMDLLVVWELEPGPEEGLSYMHLVLQLGEDGHDDSVNVNPGHCALGLPKAPRIPGWSLDWGHRASHECALERAVSKVP